MKITPRIKYYKRTVSSLNAQELLTVLNNTRLTKDERFAVELVDIYCKPIKEASHIMNTDDRQLSRWLHKARVKISRQIFK